MIELKAAEVSFYSEIDEAVFFEWLDKLTCVNKVYGKGMDIVIEVLDQEIDESELREILAIFYRYEVDMKQLVCFNCNKFSSWFHDVNSYWYKEIFE